MWICFSHGIRPPYFYGNKDKGIIHAEIRVEFLYNDTVNVFWIPGYKDTSYNCMEYFDNVVKWKADYTKEWFWNALIPKIREDEKEVNCSNCRCIPDGITDRVFQSVIQ